MGYKWKPNAAQKAEYKEKMQEKQPLHIVQSSGAIRKGCFVKYYNVNQGEIISGLVTGSSYGADKGQHTFTVDGTMVKGRNLYPNLLEHIQGEESLTIL